MDLYSGAFRYFLLYRLSDLKIAYKLERVQRCHEGHSGKQTQSYAGNWNKTMWRPITSVRANNNFKETI